MVWINFGLLLLTIFLLKSLVRICLRKMLKIERKKQNRLLYNYINKLHRKVDLIVTVIGSFILAITLYSLEIQGYSINAFLIAGLLFILVQLGITAFFEWRYSEIPKEYILIVSDMLIVTIVIISVIRLGLFNSLN